ncbi:MAG: serine hydrolase [Rubrivivax sp.]|nr:serine hydrolase [Rubrivivax sp.]
MTSPRLRRVMRRSALAALAVAAVLAAALGLALLVYPSLYVWRSVTLGDSDVDDQFRFPRREVHAAPGARELPLAPDEARVRRAFARALPGKDLERWLAANETQGFVVLQGRQVIYEGYFNGHRREDTATSFSVAKSVLGTLVDLAVAEGRIGSLDEPLTRHVPELKARDARFERITLRHLLDMNAGLHYVEYPFLTSDGAKTYYWPDLRALALQGSTVERPPGEAWLYNNYHPLLLGLVLERATGVPVAKWLQDKLWQPAGMAADASWSLDSEATGFEKLESGLNARVLDFARFGQLFLDQGVAADGTRVLAAETVRAATSPERAVSLAQLRPGAYYKHFWWGQRRADGGYDFSARGNHGQFVYVSPRNGVVIARNGRSYGVPAREWIVLFEALADALGAQAPNR